MNYQRIYNQIIDRAQSEDRQKGCGIYFEKHHIIPKCLGGVNNKSNLILLTAKEHFVAHKLLCEIYPTETKLHYAIWRMMNPQSLKHTRTYNISSTEYSRRKKIQQEYIRNLGLQNKGKTVTHSEETKKKISELGKGRVPWNKGKVGLKKGPMSDTHKANISKSLKGKKKPARTEEHSRKILLSRKKLLD